jgi:hypothetical protein
MLPKWKNTVNAAFSKIEARTTTDFDVVEPFARCNEVRTHVDNSQRRLDVVWRWVYPVAAIGTGEALGRFVVVFELAGGCVQLHAAAEVH